MVIRDWVNYRILVVLFYTFLIDLTDTEDIYDIDSEPIAERPMPPELTDILVVNKTDQEINLEDCMTDFYECTSIHLKYQLCAINEKQEKRSFLCYCDMIYENCRNNNKNPWHYLHDDEC